MAACDTVFFLDYSPQVCLDGVNSRRGKARADMPWIETEEDAEFTEFIKKYQDDQRPLVLALLEKYADKRIVIFPDRNQAKEFLKLQYP
jgi:hypothetical protein